MTRFASGVILALLFMAHAEAAPVDLSAPSSSLGNSNAYGFLTLWREYGEVDFGKDLKLPLRAQFSSENQNDSLALGKGWWLPLTEANAYLKREKMLKATLICGKTMYLRKDSAQANTFYSLDKEWKGVINGKNINISREDGWNLHYENGLIKSLKTDTGRTLTWVYSGNMAVEIKEEGSPLTPFKLDLTSNGNPKGVYVNNKLHSFALDKRPKVQNVTGKNLVTSFDLALYSWNWPEGLQETYQFEVTEEVQPNLKVTDQKASQTTYVWDAGSGRIISDGQWTYKIGKVSSDLELPELRRVNMAGKEEFVKIDNKLGIFERDTLRKGHVKTEVYKTPGPLYGKVKSIYRIEEGKQVPVLQFAYDETGRLLRQTNEKGLITVFNYGSSGRLIDSKILPPTNTTILKSLKEKEQKLLKEISEITNPNKRSSKMTSLAFFYIGEMRDVSKALELLPAIEARRQKGSVKFHVILNDSSISHSEKIRRLEALLSEYPENKDHIQPHIEAQKQIVQKEKVYAKQN